MKVQAGVTYLGDNSKAKRDLGLTPRSLEEGLREILDYEMQNKTFEVLRPRRSYKVQNPTAI